MEKIAIVTDSTASIPEELIKSLKIHTVAYYIHRGDEVLRDLVNIQRDEFYDWLKNAKTIPKTASPGPGDYVKTFTCLINELGVKGIISIHMTSKGSGAYQSAITARDMIKEKYPEIKLEVIDTLNVSLCHGWEVIEAARSIMNRVSFERTVSRVYELIPITKMIQTADTLKYLYMGGRIGKAKHLMGRLLNIKPLIGMEDGVIVPIGQVRSIQKAYLKMADIVEKGIGSQTRIKIAFVHAAARNEALKLKEIFEKRFEMDEVIIAELSPALGVHTGPGTVGICYFPIEN